MYRTKNVKRLKEKGKVTYKCRPIRITPDLSMKTRKKQRVCMVVQYSKFNYTESTRRKPEVLTDKKKNK